jgi:hypothetical protein
MFIFNYLILYEYRNEFVLIIYFIYYLNFSIHDTNNEDDQFLLLFYKYIIFDMDEMGLDNFIKLVDE